MPISFPCRGCGKVLRVRDTAAGKRAQCSQCGEMVLIPKAEETEPTEDLEEKPAAAVAVTYEPIRRQGFVLSDDDPANRRCPACGEPIKPSLSRCPTCSPNIDCSPKKPLRRRSNSWWSNPREQDLTLEDIALCFVAAPVMLVVGFIRKYHGHRTAWSILILSNMGLVFCRTVIFAFRIWVLDQKFARF